MSAIRNWLVRCHILCSTCGRRLRSPGCIPGPGRKPMHTLRGGVEGRS